MNTVRITVARGDGIGPEIMEATLKVLFAAGAAIEIDEIEIGEKVYLAGNTSGIPKEAWDIIRQNRILLKGPITTPLGGGYKSLNVTIRKALNLYANVRPSRSLYPYVRTKHPELDVIIIRENEEDLYAAIEHQQTQEVVQCLKLVSRPGCERVIRFAFEYARQLGRKKVTCFTKDNIMKQTDGLFHRVFEEIAAEYPDIDSEHLIIDIGSARLADTPERFEVIVTLNLYGDIISDIAAQLSGSVGMVGTANIGDHFAMFEAIHGSAPDIAGKNIANPSGLLNAAVMMLNYIGQNDVAENIQNAWLCTIEQGIHTPDIFSENVSKRKVGTDEFADAVIQNLGRKPLTLKPVHYSGASPMRLQPYTRKSPKRKELVGVDLFVDWPGQDPNALAAQLTELNTEKLQLVMITNRGVKVWPEGLPETFCTDHWRCRYQNAQNRPISHSDILALLSNAVEKNIDVIKTENLYTFDGERGFSLGQGQ